MLSSRFTRSVILGAGLATALAGAAVALGGVLRADEPAAAPLHARATVMIIDALPAGTVQAGVAGDASGVTGTGNGIGTFTLPPVQGGDRNAAADKAALLAIGVDRWSTQDDTAGLVQALKAKGTHGLVSALEKHTVGHLQITSALRWPIRWATTWKTDAGQVVLLATTGQFLFSAQAGPASGTDYQVDLLEFTLPPDGPGEGTIVAALRADFDDKGRIFAVAQPIGAGAQKMTNVMIATP